MAVEWLVLCVCVWQCHSHQSLDLPLALGRTGLGFDLQGSIPPELGLLTDLVLLNLSESPGLIGSLPVTVLSALEPHLEALYLEATSLEGPLPWPLPNQTSDPPVLQELRVSESPGIQADGLPQDPLVWDQWRGLQLLGWSQTKRLREYGNPSNAVQLPPASMVGKIPSELGLLSHLEYLYLGTCACMCACMCWWM